MTDKKILYIINNMDWFWSHRLPLAQGAKNKGWDVVIAEAGAAQDKKLGQYGFTGLDLPAAFGLRKTLAIHKIIKEHKPAIVHTITLKYAFMTGLAVFLNRNIQVVHTIAGLGYLFSNIGFKPALLRFLVGPFLKLALKHPNAQIIFQNPDDMQRLIDGGFVRPEHCHLIRGSGVDVKEFPYTKEPHNDPPVIIMPTRLVHDKGVSVFIDAARILKSRGTNAVFQIAGGISTSNPLAITQKEMEEMIADGTVEWLGRVSDMPALLSNCDLVVYPSYYGEGIPKVLLEAASSGRAIITTDHPGCREAVNDNDNGLLVPIKDPEATANAIEKLLANEDLRESMGEKSRARAEEEFDVQKIVEQTLKVYSAGSE